MVKQLLNAADLNEMVYMPAAKLSCWLCGHKPQLMWHTSPWVIGFLVNVPAVCAGECILQQN